MPPRRILPPNEALDVTYVRDITDADLMSMTAGQVPSRPAKASPLVRLSTTHHQLARLLAEGRSATDASVITGIAQCRISVLKADPAFKELMAHYSAIKVHVYTDVHQRLAQVAMAAVEEIQARLEEAPQDVPTRGLIEIATMALDRSGVPGASKVIHQQGDVAAEVRALFTKRTKGVIIEGEAQATAPAVYTELAPV